MSYEATLQWMFQQLPIYQRVGKAAYKADLTNTILLANHLGNPQRKFKSIHVGGTNGKGSTSHMLASVLMEAGYRVGLYTSPHLKDFRERIRINGKMIDKNYVVEFIHNNKPFFEKHQLSFFEMTVGMAFSYFRDEQVDVAVIEVGLGGRLDSTNIIHPELSVITNIGFDHMQFLGDTLEKIASEKAGIIKTGVPVVIGESLKETRPVFLSKAMEQGAEILFAETHEIPKHLKTDLKGSYQLKNLRTAYLALDLLKSRFPCISSDAISRGFLSVVQNTGLMGRWQILGEQPQVIVDTAHNKEGVREVMDQLSHQTYHRLLMVLGFVKDKDVEALLKLFKTEAEYFFCAPDIPRALPVEQLLSKAMGVGMKGQAFTTVKKALSAAKNKASDKDLIFVGGSTFVVAEVL
jgi:dihydrofolate synthase/folylpolyglutamate synthase